ncbi:uncharacterized protein TNCT_497871 [Trichonephila clavata]|uniref:Ig-like domain-containing protein n=1 Tax=Trichonephila clavata TaxID=2740835 RepID=A0A8X6LEB1_TRICU|nr:uncharacterized protein TNCT_497871 [Trichonephila clavata]
MDVLYTPETGVHESWFCFRISTPVITSGSSVSSELVIRVQLTDNGAFYRCEANNSALKKPLSAFVRLSVRFPPENVSITVQPLDPRTGDNQTAKPTFYEINHFNNFRSEKFDTKNLSHF